MAIYVGKQKAILYEGNHKPAELYSGNQKIAGYETSIASGIGKVDFNAPYEIELPKVVVEGAGKQERLEGKNLFSLDALNSSTETWVVPSKKLTIKVKPNTAYICSSNIPFPENPNELNQKTIYFCGASWSETGVAYGQPISFNSGGAGELFIAVCIDRLYADDVLAGKYYIQIEEGTTATSYEPYCGGIPAPNPQYPIEPEFVEGAKISVGGNNLWKITGFSATSIASPSAQRLTTNNYGTTINTTEPANKLIVTQSKIDNTYTPSNYRNGYFCIGFEDKSLIGKTLTIGFDINIISNPFNVTEMLIKVNGQTNQWASLPSKSQRLRKVISMTKRNEEQQDIEFRCSGMSMELSNFSLSTSSIETERYEPYYEKKIIDIPILRAVGDVKDEIDLNTGIITRRVGVFTDNGSPDWQMEQFGIYLNFYYNVPLENADKMEFVLCNMATHGNLTGYHCMVSGTGKFNICPNLSLGIKDVTSWKNYLSKYPITVYYPLATPTTEQVNPQLLTQHPGYTHLTQSGSIPATIKATYYKEEQI